MRAAAQFHRPAERVGAVLARGLAHRHHAHLVAVFFAEQRAGSRFAGVVHRHQPRRDLVILQHHFVGDILDAAQLVRGDRLGMDEVEAQAIRRHQRAALRDVVAEHLPQGLVQKMRRGVMGADRRAPGMIDLEQQRGARLQRALLHRAEMHEEIAGLLLGVGDAEAHALPGHHAGVADLAAGLRVKRRLVQNDGAALAGLEAFDLLAVLHQCARHAFGGLGLVAEEFGGAEFLAQREPDILGRCLAGAGPCRARLFALPVHRVGEGGDVDADAARFQRVLGEIERKAVGVVQRERGVAVEHVAFFQPARSSRRGSSGPAPASCGTASLPAARFPRSALSARTSSG